MKTRTLPIIRGTLDLLALKSLTWDAMHGYGIAAWLDRTTDGLLKVDDGALYQCLQRLEARGYIEAEWGLTASNREARYYSLTSEGRAHLRAESAAWVKYSRSVTDVLAMARPGR